MQYSQKNPVKSHLWKERVLIVNAHSPTHIGYKAQNQELMSGKRGIKERDLVIYRLYADHWIGPNQNPLTEQQADAIYAAYDIPRESFSVVLVGKDGGVKLRQSDIVETHTLFQIIDQMPMRKSEMQRNPHKDTWFH